MKRNIVTVIFSTLLMATMGMAVLIKTSYVPAIICVLVLAAGYFGIGLANTAFRDGVKFGRAKTLTIADLKLETVYKVLALSQDSVLPSCVVVKLGKVTIRNMADPDNYSVETTGFLELNTGRHFLGTIQDNDMVVVTEEAESPGSNRRYFKKWLASDAVSAGGRA